MEKMFQDYKDIAEFRLIYIREAHAADGSRPVQYAKEKGINQHTNYEERCTTAQLLIDDKKLTMPFLIDSMDNQTNLDYSAQPDRVFVVDKDGKIVVAAGRGPFGFKPGLDQAKKWLGKYREEANSADERQESTDDKNDANTKKIDKSKSRLRDPQS